VKTYDGITSKERLRRRRELAWCALRRAAKRLKRPICECEMEAREMWCEFQRAQEDLENGR